jgi:hypothetical protein
MKDRVMLFTLPHSGCNFVRYMIEFMTGRKTPGIARLVKEGPDILDRSHGFGPFPFCNRKAPKLIAAHPKCIFMLRDYKEHIVRNDYNPEEYAKYYMSMLRFYDKLASDKMIIYYEDLIVDPSRIIKNLLDFSRFDTIRDLSELTDNIDYHVKRSIELGNHRLSDSKSANYHQNRLTHDEKRRIDSLFRDIDPPMYKKYLLRYMTN